MLAAPILSSYDPVTEAEGSVDGLSLQRTYERLADRILPSITVRMARIRFVTAMTAGAVVCRDYDDEALAADGRTPPWLVFEWYISEGLVRERATIKRAGGIPGSLKIESAIRNKFALSAATYLKTPKVFGSTGIYRRLATGLQIITPDHNLDEGGVELVRAWQADQGLPGFLDGTTGAGAAFRTDLERAVRQGLDKARTSKQAKGFWREVCRVFRPDGAGRRERQVLYKRLTRTDLVTNGVEHEAIANRRRLIDALEARGAFVTRDGEAAFFAEVAQHANAELGSRLRAIGRYERLCRVATDAFDTIRFLATDAQCASIGAADFAELPQAGALAAAAHSAAAEVLRDQALCVWEPAAAELAQRYVEVRAPADLFEAVLVHHEEIQRAKPPDGKRPWIERGSRGQVFVRGAYTVPAQPATGRAYVHTYRTPSLSSFLVDLGRLP